MIGGFQVGAFQTAYQQVPPAPLNPTDTHDPGPANTQVMRERDYKRRLAQLQGRKQLERADLVAETLVSVKPVYRDPVDDEDVILNLLTDEDAQTAELVTLALKLIPKLRLH